MSDFEIESDGDNDFEESYGGGGRNNNKHITSRRPAPIVTKPTKKAASFFGGGGGGNNGGGGDDLYDFDFDAEAPAVKKSYDGKSNNNSPKKSPKGLESLSGGGLKRTESMSRSPTAMSLEDLLSQHTDEEDPMKKAQRMLKKYTSDGGKKATTTKIRQSMEEFNENDISLDDSDNDSDFAMRQKPTNSRLGKAQVSATTVTANAKKVELHGSRSGTIARSHGMMAGDDESYNSDMRSFSGEDGMSTTGLDRGLKGQAVYEFGDEDDDDNSHNFYDESEHPTTTKPATTSAASFMTSSSPLAFPPRGSFGMSDGQGIRAAGASFGSVGTFGSGNSSKGAETVPREPFGVVTKQPPSPTERPPFGTVVGSGGGTFGGSGGSSNTSKVTSASSLQGASQGRDKDDDDDGGSSAKPKLMTFADLGEVTGWDGQGLHDDTVSTNAIDDDEEQEEEEEEESTAGGADDDDVDDDPPPRPKAMSFSDLAAVTGWEESEQPVVSDKDKGLDKHQDKEEEEEEEEEEEAYEFESSYEDKDHGGLGSSNEEVEESQASSVLRIDPPAGSSKPSVNTAAAIHKPSSLAPAGPGLPAPPMRALAIIALESSSSKDVSPRGAAVVETTYHKVHSTSSTSNSSNSNSNDKVAVIHPSSASSQPSQTAMPATRQQQQQPTMPPPPVTHNLPSPLLSSVSSKEPPHPASQPPPQTQPPAQTTVHPAAGSLEHGAWLTPAYSPSEPTIPPLPQPHPPHHPHPHYNPHHPYPPQPHPQQQPPSSQSLPHPLPQSTSSDPSSADPSTHLYPHPGHPYPPHGYPPYPPHMYPPHPHAHPYSQSYPAPYPGGHYPHPSYPPHGYPPYPYPPSSLSAGGSHSLSSSHGGGMFPGQGLGLGMHSSLQTSALLQGTGGHLAAGLSATTQDAVMQDLLQELRRAKEDAAWAKNRLAEMIVLVNEKSNGNSNAAAATTALLKTSQSPVKGAVGGPSHKPSVSAAAASSSQRTGCEDSGSYSHDYDTDEDQEEDEEEVYDDNYDNEYSNDFETSNTNTSIDINNNSHHHNHHKKAPSSSSSSAQAAASGALPVSRGPSPGPSAVHREKDKGQAASRERSNSHSNNQGSSSPDSSSKGQGQGGNKSAKSSSVAASALAVDMSHPLLTSQALFRQQLNQLRERLNTSKQFAGWGFGSAPGSGLAPGTGLGLGDEQINPNLTYPTYHIHRERGGTYHASNLEGDQQPGHGLGSSDPPVPSKFAFPQGLARVSVPSVRGLAAASGAAGGGPGIGLGGPSMRLAEVKAQFDARRTTHAAKLWEVIMQVDGHIDEATAKALAARYSNSTTTSSGGVTQT